MGCATEGAEILDIMKKHVFYGKKLDRDHVIEEAGDVLWYLAILSDELGFSLEEAMEKNIQKLEKRYPEKFQEQNAIQAGLHA